MKMRPLILGSSFAVLLVVTVVPAGGADSSTSGSTTPLHCGDNINKVTSCLGYATGKADVPGKPCCDAVGEMKESDPACLCYIIQQTHNGSQQMVKSAGILESRLLQLPSACSLKNASISDCPRLLGIPPTSPDYAIFTNATSNATTTPSADTTTSTSSSSGTASPDKSSACVLTGIEQLQPRPFNAGMFVVTAVLSLMVHII
ncbi:hypothetical protein MLD38_017050 [Melastoma candidum]|uniref:Uncharacterized protein n=1 Tax=Melastoma candidum TaxID=119954 RepID=A0ACB9QPD1_9MYRT|nr:hypothetical protein MLD38_017050 [Melastoma candidum]